MDREIKFRAWSAEHKKMLPVHDAKFVNGRMIGAKGIGWGDTVEVMQYTGLKDKNGKEIYEGDVVREPKEVGSRKKKKEVYVFEIYFDDEVAGFLGKNNDGYQTGLGYPMGVESEVEIIGNIYENPELLGDTT